MSLNYDDNKEGLYRRYSLSPKAAEEYVLKEAVAFSNEVKASSDAVRKILINNTIN